MKEAPTISPEYRERLNDRLTVIHRRDAVPTTTDALLLAAFLPKTEGCACELGAGGGIISLLAASRDVFSRGILIEREPILASLAERNIEENGLADRLSVLCRDLRDYTPAGRFSLVFANPPYRRAGSGLPAAHRLADVSRFERAGGIRDFCLAAARLLTDDGVFTIVFPTARREELWEALQEAKLHPEAVVTVLPYPEGKSRLTLVRARPFPTIPKNYTLALARAADDRRPTPEAEILYERGVLPL